MPDYYEIRITGNGTAEDVKESLLKAADAIGQAITLFEKPGIQLSFTYKDGVLTGEVTPMNY